MSAGLIGGAAGAGVLNATQQAQRGENNRFGELNSDEFVKILITELTNQDPFEPNDSAAILEQLSSLRTIESQTALQDKLESLVLQNSIAQAGALIGRLVQGLDQSNERISGLVTAVRVADGEAVLELDTGLSLSLDRVELISDAPGA